MKATVNVLCYKFKTLKNGEHPLMICMCKGGKRKYISIGKSNSSQKSSIIPICIYAAFTAFVTVRHLTCHCSCIFSHLHVKIISPTTSVSSAVRFQMMQNMSWRTISVTSRSMDFSWDRGGLSSLIPTSSYEFTISQTIINNIKVIKNFIMFFLLRFGLKIIFFILSLYNSQYM